MVLPATSARREVEARCPPFLQQPEQYSKIFLVLEIKKFAEPLDLQKEIFPYLRGGYGEVASYFGMNQGFARILRNPFAEVFWQNKRRVLRVRV